MVLPAAAVAGTSAPSAASAPSALGSTKSASGASPDFASSLTRALDQLQSVTQTADHASLQAAAGQGSVAKLMVDATEASLETQLVTTVRDKAIAAFTQVMNLPA
jgi:flagellar hook-basal body complex protein FliE